MSVGMTTIKNAKPSPLPQTGSSGARRSAVARRQRLLDVLFHRITQAFSLLVLAALVGIMVSLFINAWPTRSVCALMAIEASSVTTAGLPPAAAEPAGA